MNKPVEALFRDLSEMAVETSKVKSETWKLVAEYEQQFRNEVQPGYEDAAAHACRTLIGERVASETAAEENAGNRDSADRWRIVLSCALASAQLTSRPTAGHEAGARAEPVG